MWLSLIVLIDFQYSPFVPNVISKLLICSAKCFLFSLHRHRRPDCIQVDFIIIISLLFGLLSIIVINWMPSMNERSLNRRKKCGGNFKRELIWNRFSSWQNQFRLIVLLQCEIIWPPTNHVNSTTCYTLYSVCRITTVCFHFSFFFFSFRFHFIFSLLFFTFLHIRLIVGSTLYVKRIIQSVREAFFVMYFISYIIDTHRVMFFISLLLLLSFCLSAFAFIPFRWYRLKTYELCNHFKWFYRCYGDYF